MHAQETSVLVQICSLLPACVGWCTSTFKGSVLPLHRVSYVYPSKDPPQPHSTYYCPYITAYKTRMIVTLTDTLKEPLSKYWSVEAPFRRQRESYCCTFSDCRCERLLGHSVIFGSWRRSFWSLLWYCWSRGSRASRSPHAWCLSYWPTALHSAYFFFSPRASKQPPIP